jgi:hypothetical protein
MQSFVRTEGKRIENDGVSGWQTDYTGHLYANGLAAGEFRLVTSLRVDATRVESLFGSSNSVMLHMRSMPSPYFEGMSIREDEKTIKLDDGQNASGMDFTILVSKLCAISGSLVDARSRRVLNAGTVFF